MAIQVRYLGIVQPIALASAEDGKKFIQHVKAAANMDVGERRRPLDGRWIYNPEEGDPVDLRVSMIPTLYGEDLALRVIPRNSNMLALEHLGLIDEQLQTLQQLIQSPSGMILITGPTGVGKTSTLYACLSKLNDGRKKINTIEDPIEFAVPGLRQSQVNNKLNVGFSELLRSVLRQSPDIIMVGEIRDGETADTAVRAANSGHLVFATLHAATSTAAIQSMKSLGVHPHFLSTSLHGVVAQRLLRTLCDRCKARWDLDPTVTFNDVRPWLKSDEGTFVYAPQGCKNCHMSGYTGRTGVFEVLQVNREIRAMIAQGKPTADVRAKATEHKMLDFRQAAMIKVAKGETSLEEVMRVIPTQVLQSED
jgi:type II secretory ATPase GspE/PulE/Tfp pilus assembly ATPase PilB-like protein